MKRLVNLVFCVLLAACAAEVTPKPPIRPAPSPASSPTKAVITNYSQASPADPLPITAPSRTPRPTKKPSTIVLPALQPTSTLLPNVTPFDVDAWKEQPIIPNVDPSISAIYQYGQTLGNEPGDGLARGSGTKRDDQPDRPARIDIGMAGGGSGCSHRRKRQHESALRQHPGLPRDRDRREVVGKPGAEMDRRKVLISSNIIAVCLWRKMCNGMSASAGA